MTSLDIVKKKKNASPDITKLICKCVSNQFELEGLKNERILIKKNNQSGQENWNEIQH